MKQNLQTGTEVIFNTDYLHYDEGIIIEIENNKLIHIQTTKGLVIKPITEVLKKGLVKVGSIFTLKVPCLHNEVNTIGIAFNHYENNSVQVIFENGNFDGFNPAEIISFLNYEGQSDLDYCFTNVIKLDQDFEEGKFKNIYEKFKRSQIYS